MEVKKVKSSDRYFFKLSSEITKMQFIYPIDPFLVWDTYLKSGLSYKETARQLRMLGMNVFEYGGIRRRKNIINYLAIRIIVDKVILQNHKKCREDLQLRTSAYDDDDEWYTYLAYLGFCINQNNYPRTVEFFYLHRKYFEVNMKPYVDYIATEYIKNNYSLIYKYENDERQ